MQTDDEKEVQISKGWFSKGKNRNNVDRAVTNLEKEASLLKEVISSKYLFKGIRDILARIKY